MCATQEEKLFSIPTQSLKDRKAIPSLRAAFDTYLPRPIRTSQVVDHKSSHVGAIWEARTPVRRCFSVR
jgi:hypothetical protein